MNKYLLDTDACIDFLKNKEPGASMVNIALNSQAYLSVVTWSELLYGIKKSTEPQKRFAELNQFIDELDIEIIPIEQEICSIYVDLKIGLEKRGDKLADFDILIAASALVNNSTIVTRNQSHYERIKNLKLLKPGS